MKDTRLFRKESSNEEEKTKLEQIEEEVKTSIFSVFYLLLKNQETTFWKFIVLLIIEYLQLLSFSFDPSMVKIWKADDVVRYFAQFLSTFRIVYWLQKLSWDVYVIVFYICIFLVFIIIIDFLYVSISFKHKKFSFMQPIQILRIACILIITILYIPITEFFFSISECTSNADGMLHHDVFVDETCFESIHVLHAALSYLILLIFWSMTLLACLMNYENRYTKDPTSKINAKTDILQILSKTAYVFIFTFFHQEDYSMFKSVILCIFSTIVFLSYLSNKPYFNQTTQIIVEIFSAIFAWTNYVLVFSQIISNSKFNGSLQIYFLGIPIICILIYTKSEDRLMLLLTSEAQIQKGDLCQKKNFFYMHIIETKEIDRYSAIILKGYINHHTEVCPFDSCPIKAFKKLMLREKANAENERKKKGQGGKLAFQNSENNSLLLAQAKALYNNGIKKFPKYIALRIDYANFLQSRMKDRKGALNELAQAEKLKPGLDHQFMIFRQRRIIEDELTEGQEHGGVDFIAALNFENQFNAFKQLIEKSSMLHYEFWNHLLDDSPDLVRLSQQGAKINASIMTVEDHWKKLSKMSTNTPKALKLYASYLIEVLNDKETGNEQMIKAKEAANLRVNFEFNNVNEDYTDLNNYAQDGTPCIYISGEQERLGIVNQCNMSLCKIFGYTKKDDVINKDVEMLMPKLYSDNHKDFLNLSIQKSADQISSRERQIFGKHFSGYIFPLWLQIKNLPSLLSGRQYVATFKVEKTGINKNVVHLLLNKDKEVMDISPQCLPMLGISFDKLQKKQIYYDVQSLIPQIFQANNQQYMNKAGALVNFYYPRIVDMVDQKRKDANAKNGDDEEDSKQDKGNTGDMTGRGGPGGVENDDGSRQDMVSQLFDQDDYVGEGTMGGVKSSKSLKVARKGDDNDNDDNDNNENDGGYQLYQYKAIGSMDRAIPFQCNLSEIYFELIQHHAGYHLRLESVQDRQQNQSIRKKVKQPHFQFSYDPLFKKFTRELRDVENKDFLMDKFFLNLKLKKEQSKFENPDDPNAHKFANMSYINYLNKQQRMIERGANGDFDEDDDNQSSDDSNLSDEDNSKNNKNKAKGDDKKEEQANAQQAKNSLVNLTPNVMPQTSISGANIIDYNKILVAGEGFGKDFLKSEIERLIKVLQEKQQMGKEIHTFVRLDGPKRGWEEDNNQRAGLFSDRSAEIQKIEEEEDDAVSKDGERDKDGDQLKANIKSKKAFSMAINDKTMPPAIKRLSITAQIILLFLIAIATAEYAILFKQFSDTKANFMLIEKAFLRTAELQKVAYNARSMILMSENLLTNYAGYASRDEYVDAIKKDFSDSLDLIYKIQNEINLSQLRVSDDHNQLLNNKTVTLYFKEDATNMKPLDFSLTEGILQISSTIFTISNMKIKDFNETNEDVFFLIYNSFNEFLIGLQKSQGYYVQELNDRSEERKEVSLILYILSICALVICFLVLIPVVHSVNQQKDKVLQLFCEIDNSVIRALAFRCENFINNMQAEEGNDDIESNEDIENGIVADEEDEYSLLSGTGKKIKKAKGRTKTDKKFFLQFLLALLCIHAYYLQNYLLQEDAITTTQILNAELNVTSITEPFYWFALNTQREMLYNPNRTVIKQNSLQISKQTIYQLYDQNKRLQQMHLDHQNYLSGDYWNMFESIMREDLCNEINYFKNYDQCSSFVSGTLTQGLHVVVIRYFETLRNNLNNYQNYTFTKDYNKIKQMFNIQSYNETYVIQNFVTQKFMRTLVSTLSESIQTEFSFRTERKIALFIVYLIVILIAFIIFWVPFLNGLNYQIYKTKLMLMIIPLEVLMKIKNVAKVLQSQSFLTTNKKQGKNDGSGSSGQGSSSSGRGAKGSSNKD